MRSTRVTAMPARSRRSRTSRRPSATSATPTWKAVPKIEVSTTQGSFWRISMASTVRSAATSRMGWPMTAVLSSRGLPPATMRPAWMRRMSLQYSASSR